MWGWQDGSFVRAGAARRTAPVGAQAVSGAEGTSEDEESYESSEGEAEEGNEEEEAKQARGGQRSELYQDRVVPPPLVLTDSTGALPAALSLKLCPLELCLLEAQVSRALPTHCLCTCGKCSCGPLCRLLAARMCTIHRFPALPGGLHASLSPVWLQASSMRWVSTALEATVFAAKCACAASCYFHQLPAAVVTCCLLA